MKRLLQNVSTMLIALALLFSMRFTAKAATPAAKILEGDITDKTTGLVYEATSIYNYGPDDFAIINDSDIVILDNLSYRLQRYCGGKYYETIQLPTGQDYLRLYASGRTLYVLSRSSLYMIDLDTKKQTEIMLPYENKDDVQNNFGLLVNDIISINDKIILVTEICGNFSLNVGCTAFEKVPSDYCAFREGGLGGKTISVKLGDQHWDIEADNCCGYPIGRNADGDLFMYLLDLNLSVYDKNYCRILRYSPDGMMNAVSTVDISKWAHTPRAFTHMSEDGKVYVLGIYADKFIVYKLEVGKEDIREPERPVPKINMGPIEQETAHEGEGGVKAAPNVSKSRSQVQTRALGMINLTWTFANGNNRWPEYGATAPAHLASVNLNTTQTGIPYCYGGMNGYADVPNHAKFSSIISTLDPNNNSKRLYAAGHTGSPSNNKTVGVDCATFAGSAYGYTSLVTTSDFSSSSYFSAISPNDLLRMDLVVKVGHARLFNRVLCSATQNLEFYECIHDNYNDKACTIEKTVSNLNTLGYSYKRPNSWENCTHSLISAYYSYNTTEHWKPCLFCDYRTAVGTHSYVLQNGLHVCSVCGYVQYQLNNPDNTFDFFESQY